jgi:nitroreductase
MEMNTIEAIYARKSMRAFIPEKTVDEAVVRELVEIAGRAPSWSSSQPWEVYVVTGKKLETLKSLWRQEMAAGMPANFNRSDIPGPGYDDWKDMPKCVQNMVRWKENRVEVTGLSNDEHGQLIGQGIANFFDAPACVYLCLHKSLSYYSYYDLGAFGQTFMLAATAKGLHTLPAYGPALFADIAHKEIGIPDNLNIVLGIYIGHANLDHIMNKPNAEHMTPDQYLTIVS